MVAHSYNPSIQEGKNQSEFKIILGYTVSSRSSWMAGNAISNQSTGLERCSAVKSMQCSYRAAQFGSQNPHPVTCCRLSLQFQGESDTPSFCRHPLICTLMYTHVYNLHRDTHALWHCGTLIWRQTSVGQMLKMAQKQMFL